MNKIEKPSEKIETFTCRSCKRVLDLTERGAFSYSHGQVCVRCIERLSREREVNEKKERTVDNKTIKCESNSRSNQETKNQKPRGKASPGKKSLARRVQKIRDDR